jgi:hypothetical protein
LVRGRTKKSRSTEYPAAAVLKKEMPIASTKTVGSEEILA